MDSRTAFGIVFGLWMSLAPASSFAQTPADTPIPSDAEIGKILKDHVGPENPGIGIVVGVVDARGRRIVSYGSQGARAQRKEDYRYNDQAGRTGSMRNFFAGRTANRANSTSPASCAIATGGSVCVGAMASSKGTRRNSCTTNTNTFRYRAITAAIT